ncbi:MULTISPECIES: hypothetical protein [Pseudomonas]|uniref:Uncharacterized protein n=1 Tax=Pseudomonas quercus TaxID=2722792 RepID=A0ABX0YF64_9PSED|nr:MULTISPECIES: hypothetical protein [Pseudomonas]MBF7142999.1 hypothetical protein [Pseudomonas sp. LY10J]NJP01547.1 hypothetical protein [Pseudomonas quercus]
MNALLAAALMLFIGVAHATDSPAEDETPEGYQAGEMQEPVLSRKKRSVAPVAGMACSEGHKLVGEDCVKANVAFE